ncbi:hypothetical protein JG687_00015253 [Phytophthora cactorum]|uniref:Uncharacterized protein n=1 Tax=Phytophthora cactorum TaxID=29920 RepID=A0A8T1TXB9_9STRA|nr:hypothetical protein JG687_00015253 [Phytophthora cactorum]
MNAVSGSTTETEAFGLLSPARTLRPPPHVILIADIPDWFVEAYESDDYDTDALMFIMRPVSPSRRRSVESRHSSPGLNDVQGMKSC